MGGVDCAECGHKNPSTYGACVECGAVFEKMRRISSRRSSATLAHQRTESAAPPVSKKKAGSAVGGTIIVGILVLALGSTLFFGDGHPATTFHGATVGEGTSTIVLLHSKGGTATKLDGMVRNIVDNLPGVTVVVPSASHNFKGGMAWMVGRTSDEVMASAKASAQQLRRVLADLVDKRVVSDTIYLGGVGQGAEMILELLVKQQSPPQLGGVFLLDVVLPEEVNHQSDHLARLSPELRVFVAHDKGYVEGEYAMKAFKAAGVRAEYASDTDRGVVGFLTAAAR